MLKALLVELDISFKILIVKKEKVDLILYNVVFEKLLRLKILIRRRHLIIIKVTHNINYLY